MNEPTDRPGLERNRRPEGGSDERVAAVGKFGEALEWVERARGHLYDFHQMMGHADALIGEAADELREAYSNLAGQRSNMARFGDEQTERALLVAMRSLENRANSVARHLPL